MASVKERNEEDQELLWRRIPKGIFREVSDVFYFATPSLAGLRKKQGYSIRDIAQRAGISPAFYCAFEQGKERASKEYIRKIEAALNGRRPRNIE